MRWRFHVHVQRPVYNVFYDSDGEFWFEQYVQVLLSWKAIKGF